MNHFDENHLVLLSLLLDAKKENLYLNEKLKEQEQEIWNEKLETGILREELNKIEELLRGKVILQEFPTNRCLNGLKDFIKMFDNSNIGLKKEENNAEYLDVNLRALGELGGQNVHPDVFVFEQGVAGGQQEHGTKHVPLQFQPGIRTRSEYLADHRIAGADQHHQQGDPCHGFSNPHIQRVDGAR